MAAREPTPTSEPRSGCPIANALDLLGDRWTLLVIRDLTFRGKRRFGDFLTSPEGIPTNLLTDRLRRLEESGVVERVPYQDRPPRYEYQLTAMGKDLFPVLRTLIEWALRHIPGVALPSPGALERLAAAFQPCEAPLPGPEQ